MGSALFREEGFETSPCVFSGSKGDEMTLFGEQRGLESFVQSGLDCGHHGVVVWLHSGIICNPSISYTTIRLYYENGTLRYSITLDYKISQRNSVGINCISMDIG